MQFAYPSQRLQDWISQQWVIWQGQRINPTEASWLMGPFGNVDYIADDFIAQLAADEHLTVERQVKSAGILTSIQELGLSDSEYARLSPGIKDFYENTSRYQFDLRMRWNPFYRLGGGLINVLYSNRLKQLNFPLNPRELSTGIQSEIITLREADTGRCKYTIWYRTLPANGRVLYAGIYTTCKLPSGKVCVKVVLPLPRGNATVVLKPTVEENGALCLKSLGKKYGDPGFYFLLSDSKGGYWAQYIRSFRERLTVSQNRNGTLSAEHSLSLWHQHVMNIYYTIRKK